MHRYIEQAVNFIDRGEMEEALEQFDDLEYYLREEGGHEEVLELLADTVEATQCDERIIALTYCYMLIDLMTRTQDIKYVPTGELVEITKEMTELQSIVPATKKEEVEIEMNLRRMNVKLLGALRADHDLRFP